MASRRTAPILLDLGVKWSCEHCLASVSGGLKGGFGEVWRREPESAFAKESPGATIAKATLEWDGRTSSLEPWRGRGDLVRCLGAREGSIYLEAGARSGYIWWVSQAQRSLGCFLLSGCFGGGGSVL